MTWCNINYHNNGLHLFWDTCRSIFFQVDPLKVSEYTQSQMHGHWWKFVFCSWKLALSSVFFSSLYLFQVQLKSIIGINFRAI